MLSHCQNIVALGTLPVALQENAVADDLLCCMQVMVFVDACCIALLCIYHCLLLEMETPAIMYIGLLHHAVGSLLSHCYLSHFADTLNNFNNA